VSFKRSAGAFAVRARRVVLALPFTLLRGSISITAHWQSGARLPNWSYGTNANS
jgi:hypothetical protein